MEVRQYNYPRLEDVLRDGERKLDGLHFDGATRPHIITAEERLNHIRAAMSVGEEYVVDH